jgi:hypothetical protein
VVEKVQFTRPVFASERGKLYTPYCELYDRDAATSRAPSSSGPSIFFEVTSSLTRSLTRNKSSREPPLATRRSLHGEQTLNATGITDYLKSNGSLSEARKMAIHADTTTTQLYDRRGDEASLDEYEKVGI